MFSKILTSFLACIILGTTVHAAVIQWSHEQFTTSHLIRKNGMLIDAINFGSAQNQVELNGVLFDSFGPTIEGITVTNGSPSAYGDFFNPNHPFANTLMDSGNYSASGIKITMTGLTVGASYVVQAMTGDNRSGISNRTVTYTGAGDNTVLYTNDPYGFIFTGEFIADSPIQEFMITGSTEGLINGFQLRLAPEPTKALLLSLSACVGLTVRRRAHMA